MSEAAVETVLAARALEKVFTQGSQTISVIDNLDLTLGRGQRIAIIGQSGAGKSTLLHLLGGLDAPDSGQVHLHGHSLAEASETRRGQLRNRYLGFIYQFHHLLPEFSALDNVAMPLLIRGLSVDEAHGRAEKMLGLVGLQPRLTHKPGELSGGERQRAAVARALVGEPSCVLADEPTGNLDRRNAEQVFDLMLDINDRLGTSLVMVTHDTDLAARMDSLFLLRDGRLHEETD